MMMRMFAMPSFVVFFFISIIVKVSCYPHIIAHRGASGYLPEHSIPAYELAINLLTNYIEPDLCLTKDGNCDKMAGSYESEKVNNAEEVYQILADEMADCWWTFGEGKLNYVGSDFKSNLYCSLCSNNRLKSQCFPSRDKKLFFFFFFCN